MKPRVIVIIALSVVVVATIIAYQAVSASKTNNANPSYNPQPYQPAYNTENPYSGNSSGQITD